jgi:putative transposase
LLLEIAPHATPGTHHRPAAEERSIAQIASEYGVHPNQLYKWKAQAVENLPGLFEDDRKGEKSLKAEHERQLKELYAKIE